MCRMLILSMHWLSETCHLTNCVERPTNWSMELYKAVLYFAAPATKIVAQPGTITGSIGVAFGKTNTSQAFKDQGINMDSIWVGQNADMGSEYADYTSDQAKIVNGHVDRY